MGKNQNAPIPSEIAYATLWDSGIDYLPPARWPVGSPWPERLPMPRGRYSIRSVSNDGAKKVGCDVSSSWVGLGWVVLWLGLLEWWASVSGGCCVVVGSGGGGRGSKPRVGGCALCCSWVGFVGVVGVGVGEWWVLCGGGW